MKTHGHFPSGGVFPTIDHVSDARQSKFRMNWIGVDLCNGFRYCRWHDSLRII